MELDSASPSSRAIRSSGKSRSGTSCTSRACLVLASHAAVPCGTKPRRCVLRKDRRWSCGFPFACGGLLRVGSEKMFHGRSIPRQSVSKADHVIREAFGASGRVDHVQDALLVSREERLGCSPGGIEQRLNVVDPGSPLAIPVRSCPVGRRRKNFFSSAPIHCGNFFFLISSHCQGFHIKLPVPPESPSQTLLGLLRVCVGARACVRACAYVCDRC